jgi:GMP synthase-like glutamine amidotransferase
MADNKAVLGICLGAQLIASALGARVYSGPEKEIGWFPVFAELAVPGTFVLPAMLEAFHWHGETFDLPSGAVHLASSAACRNQAFQIGARTIGLQFHLETTPQSASAMIAHCGTELVPQRYIQTEAALRGVPGAHYAGINALMNRVLDYLVRNGG